MKKNAQWTFRAVFLPLLFGFLPLTSCGGGDEPVTRQGKVDLEGLDPSGQEVVFWYQHTREREDELLQMIEDFNGANPHGITVRGEYAGKYNDIYNKMIVGLQGGTLPHLVVAYQNQARAYYQEEGAVDLNPFMVSPKWGLDSQARADFFQPFLKQDNIDGVQTGLPPNRSMEVLYYNMDWLQELGYDVPPATWDQFAEMCRKARDQPFSKSPDRSRSLGFLLEIDASRLASMIFSRGGDLVDAEGKAYTFDTPELRATLGRMMALMEEKAVGIVSEDYGDQKEFSVGQLLFVLRSSSGLPYFKSAIEEDGVGFRWGVTHLPSGPAGPVVNVYGASISVCKTTPEGQLAAWLFLKWFTEPAQQARWVRASNYFPVRKSTAQELVEYFAENPQYKAAYDLLGYGKSEPSVAGYQQVRRLIQDAMVEIFDGGDVGQVLERLETAANRSLAEQ
jgi:multiple sugar transport system substrate-binding protein